MSLQASMYQHKEKIFKYLFGCSPDIIPSSVVITPFFQEKEFKEHCEIKTFFKGRLYSGMIAVKDSREFGLIHCGIGSSLAGDATALLGRTRAEKIIFAGGCAGLGTCGIGDVILSERAFNGEGFSRYYAEGFKISGLFASKKYIAADTDIVETAENFWTSRTDAKTVLLKGDIFTIGSLLAETDENISVIKEKGFTGIDMELSAVYSAARQYGKKAVGLLLISDKPQQKPLWEKLSAKEKEKYNKSLRELVRFSVEFMVRI